MNISEDELEQRLRALFADERLDLPPPPDAGTVIVTGARRRRRRRHVVQAVAGVAAAVVAVSGGLTMIRFHAEDGTAVMSADGTGTSGKPPENLTAGRSPEPSPPGPTGTQSIQASAPPGASTSRPPRPPSTPRPSTLPGVATGPLLAADGFGQLKLGMSEADVTALAVTLSDPQAGASCTVYKAQGSGVPVAASVVISKAAGLVVVTPDVAAHTAEGIGAGATKDQILAAYPAAKEESGDVVAPAGTAAEYRFRLGETGVVQTSLSSRAQDCAG
ncbi:MULTISPECIES: hypothetical protein [unclassified Amycolatopsis]|uniref:hypothetical protein n=1 Tax=unclassified Amycolatopsis TaxID=2618356 RepID=UPI0028749236|nr:MULTISPECIES: hypothetical protein [unclassified Amycolatopsis]MDS0132933.1 hypothetical protein [Amycolatopsis sp. 505]MDS0142242.1 hypothetical protein [Amycolatopsis sp. CM201R]